MKYLFCVLALLFTVTTAVSAQAQDEPVTDLQWYQGFFRKRQQHPETLLQQAEQRLDEALRTGHRADMVRTHLELGLLQLTQFLNYDKAMDHLVQSLSIEDSLDLRRERVFTAMAIAQVFEEVGNPLKSAAFLEQALQDARQQNMDTRLLVMILNKLGRTYAALGDLDKAFDRYEHVLEYKNLMGNTRVEAEALYNIAQLEVQQGHYQEALKTHRDALKLRRDIKDKDDEAASLNEIGELYAKMKNAEKALANHLVALDIRKTLKNKAPLAETYNNIGVLYYRQKQYERAVANLKLGLEAAQESQDQHQIRKSYEYLALSYKELKKFEEALMNRERFVAISELIQNERNEQQLLETQNRYAIDQRESKINQLQLIRQQREKELADEKRFRNILIAAVILAAIVVVLVYRLYQQKQRSNRQLQAANAIVQEQNVKLQDLNATKDKFFSIISHDLKGPLNSLTSFSGLLINHTDSLSKDEIRMLAQDLDKSVKNLFALLENLLEWSRSQTGNIEFKPEVFNITEVLNENQSLLQAQARQKQITVTQRFAQAMSVRAHRNSIQTVVRNLVSNAIKFTPAGGQITLDLQVTGRMARVSITDTGVGMSPEVIQKLFRIDTKHSTKGTAEEKGTGLGLILCKDFVEKNGGTIGVDSKPGQGSVFYFTVPLA